MATLIVLFLLLNLLYFPSFFVLIYCSQFHAPTLVVGRSSSRHPSHADRPLPVEAPLTSLRICSQPLTNYLPYHSTTYVSYRANKRYYLP
jgi:hypothetical protein